MNKTQTIKNAISLMEKLNELDLTLENKFIRNSYEVRFYKNLLNNTNESFENITKDFIK